MPDDLRLLVGKREEKRTLGTRDPTEARIRHVAELAKLDERWATLRRGQGGTPVATPTPTQTVTLNERQAHERAAWLYEFWLHKHRDNPSQQTFWPTDLYADLWIETSVQPPLWQLNDALSPAAQSASDVVKEMKLIRLRQWCLDQADELLAVRDWITDEQSRLRLAKAMAAAVQRASLVLERLARGEAVEAATMEQEQHRPVDTSVRKPVDFDALLKGWQAEKRPQAKTVYEWSREISKFIIFLGHSDAARVVPSDVIGWKEALIADGLSAKTINDSKLAAVRTVLQWAVDSRRLPENAAAEVRMDVKRTTKSRRSFTDAEAAILLRAALAETNPVLRWVPWLCAYSGARLSEVCQLRAEDICEVEGIWCMRIDAEAGSVKTASSERTVPLHNAVLGCGFLDFVRGVGAGPLFADLSPDKFDKRGGNGTKMLGRWVRGLGLDEKRLAPAHSWRHRMKTLARRHGLADDVVRAIMGHSGRTVADTYGEFEVVALRRELMKIPVLSLST